MQIAAVLVSRQRPAAGRVDRAVDHDVGDVHAVLGILLGQHLRQGAHHDPGVVQRLPGHALLAAQRTGVVGEEKRPLAFLPHRRQHFLGDEKRARGRRCAASCRTSPPGCIRGVPCRAADRGPRGSPRCRPARPGRRPRGGSWRTPRRSNPARRDPARRSCIRRPARGWPPPVLRALASLRVVSTVKKPSWANFCATAPPTPQRTPTGTSLSSTVLPCASKVLRPSDCHLEVAPTTTATCLPFDVCFHCGNLLGFCSVQTARFQPHQAQSASPMTSLLSSSPSHGSSSVNIVTHCRQEQGILVMSVPQNIRCGPKAS